jgi:hypothetical protein
MAKAMSKLVEFEGKILLTTLTNRTTWQESANVHE